jgi:hypothetical protein
MAEFERDMDRLLAGDVDVVSEGGANAQAGPEQRARSRWPWHLAVAAIFVVGIGTAAILARAGKGIVSPPAVALPVLSVPAVTPPLAKKFEPSTPVVVSAPPPSALLERIRRVGKTRPARPAISAPETAPPSKKSKADDKVPPSPYTP